MAAVDQSTYEAFIGGTEVYAMDMDDKIKGVQLRGKTYTVSQDGLCPRCGNSNRLYVILDKLFPMGDMPEILHTLIAKGRAVLWSSQEKEGYRDPPTFLCRGFCPPDPLGAGFNVNWDNVSLNQILESLDKPVQKAINPVSSSEESSIQVERSSQDESSDNSMQVLDEFRAEKSDDERNLTQTSVTQSSSDKEEETEEEDQEEEEDDDDELDEEELIKQMLAKEQQKLSQESNQPIDDDDDENEETDAPSAPFDSDHLSEQTMSSCAVISSTTTVTTSATETVSHSNSSSTVSSTANTYPVSSTGCCPYCGASDVKYIIIVSENTKDTELPQSLQELLKRNHAFKMAKGNSEPPSFQCQKCQYGFNLNWSKTNLEEIFGLQPTASAPAATKTSPYTSTASMPYQPRPASYMTTTAYPHYPPPSILPPRYPPPVGVPPPVPYHGYPSTYPSYYGSYYNPPSIPQPTGSYSPYSPAVAPPRIPLPGTIPPGMPPPGMPPPGIPPPGIPLPGIPPPGIPTPGIPPAIPHPGIPPGMPPPGVPPPGIPTPGIPPVIPPPRTPPPGYLPPAFPRIPPPATAWGSYTRPTYPTRPHYPPTSTGYLLPPTGRPYQPPPQIMTPVRARAPRPLYQPVIHSGMSAPPGATPSQQEPSAEQTAEGEVSKVAAARFEMVLNQIDLAKARVRHEKEIMKEFQKEVFGTSAADTEMPHQQDTEEPNALTDEGQSMPEYDEKPPGDDTGFGSNVIITQSSEETKIADLPVNTSATAHSVTPSEPIPEDTNGKLQVPVHERNSELGNAIDNAAVETGHDSKTDLGDEDVENGLPQTVETSPKKAVPTRGGRPGRSKQQDKLLLPTPVVSTRQTRRSRKPEPTTSTEDTDSTAGEEEAVVVTARSRRSQKTRPPSRGVKRLEIGVVQDNEVLRSAVASDVEMGESSDMLSQSSAVPQTESDSQEVPSESLPSSSEAEAAPVAPSTTARPQRGRATRGRKRKQESVEKEADVPGSSVRKSRKVETENVTFEELNSEENEEAEDEQMLVENPVVLSQEEDTAMTTTNPRVGRSKRGVTQPNPDYNESTAEDSNLDQSETGSTTVTQEPDKPTAEILASRRQTRRSAQIPQEPEELTISETKTDPVTAESTDTVHKEDGAQEDEKTTSNRRTRRLAPRNVSQESVLKTASQRQTRKSLHLHPQESDAPDTEQKADSNQDQMLESDTPSDSKLTDGQPSLLVEQKEIAPNGSLGAEGKANRRTRKSRKSSASSEDTMVSSRVEVHSSQESDASTTTEELATNRQTRFRKSPALRKLQTTQSDTPTVGEVEQTPPTRKSRRRSSASNEDTTEDVQFTVAEPDTPEGSASSNRTRRNKSAPTTQETTELSQELDSLTAEGDIEEDDSIMPQKRASRKSAPVQSTTTVTKRVTRNRQKK